MPADDGQFEDDEILLRRIPPSTENVQSTVVREEGGFRASSMRLSLRTNEHELSCSRLQLTSPRFLLDDLRHDGIDPDGWYVCEFRVSDVREVGLQVSFTPTDRDPGHCSVTDVDGPPYPKAFAKKLARRTRILTDEEIEELS